MIEITNSKTTLCLFHRWPLWYSIWQSVEYSFWAAGGSSDMGLIFRIRPGFFIIQASSALSEGWEFIQFCDISRESTQEDHPVELKGE